MLNLFNKTKYIHKNSLFINTSFYNISLRFMHRHMARTTTFLSKSPLNHFSRLSSRNAVRTINKSDYTTKDPKALQNNPFYGNQNKRHFECHRESCAQPNCISKDCPTLCDTAVKNEAVGHATHGQSDPNEPGKKTIVVSSTDLDNKKKAQKVVIYSKPHRTPKTKEHINGTKKLNNESFMKKTIMHHEDKK